MTSDRLLLAVTLLGAMSVDATLTSGPSDSGDGYNCTWQIDATMEGSSGSTTGTITLDSQTLSADSAPWCGSYALLDPSFNTAIVKIQLPPVVGDVQSDSQLVIDTCGSALDTTITVGGSRCHCMRRDQIRSA